jgi:catechol 2,3-dioxygenase-like lactoylglutathione lyase family enzyme
MSSTQVSTEQQPAAGAPVAATVDLKLEVMAIPVSDVDRAKAFYQGLGWTLDADFMVGKDFRAVQLTPPGSPCSIHLSTTAVPGSAQGMFLVVSDIEAARNELIARGADVSGVFHFDGDHRPVPGPDSTLPSYGSYASFGDPDGNRWVLQQVKTRLPGRGLSLDVATLTDLFQETEQRHGTYEPGAPKHHWSGWYAAYVVARERGRTPDDAAREATLHIEGPLAAQR